MDGDPAAGRTGAYQGRASMTPPADAAEVPAARCVGFVRALVRGHYARADGRCACGHGPLSPRRAHPPTAAARRGQIFQYMTTGRSG